MAVLLSLLAAVGYGGSDYLAGIAGRRGSAVRVALLAQPFGLLAALVGLLVVPIHHPPTLAELGWGALSGLGSGFGIVVLYRGLAKGEMAVVAPVAGVLTALLPAGAGLALGNRPGTIALLGIALALPAVALVSWQPGSSSLGKPGLLEGVAAGACFALLFISLDRAGTAAGTWPLVPGQTVAILLIAGQARLAERSGGPARPGWRRLAPLAVLSGITGGLGNILFLSATGLAELAVVAVITSLYPAVTVLLARFLLKERWSRSRALGLGVAAVVVALISW